ncbi:hypothetical protein [Streptomyces sp. NPDC007355]|uniref:hypothetical protein n=1 Tax=unclassified Streptomyces TaxID=2593676 RepID=UPI00369C45DF
MPVSDRRDLELDEGGLLDIHWTWGIDFPGQRRWTDGWGVSIELPAVIELLDLIASGQADAAAVRARLADEAEALDAENDPHHGDPSAQEYARCFGDCDTCTAAEPGFRRTLAESKARADKARDHENYPYIVQGRTAHSAGCYHVDPERFDGGDLRESELRTRLKWYAHNQGVSVYSGEPVNRDGLVRWAQANTGPKGGRNYRACKSCNPQIP